MPYPGFWQGVWLVALYCAGGLAVTIPCALIGGAPVRDPLILGLAALAGAFAAVGEARARLGVGWREIAGPFSIPAAMAGPMAAMMAGQLLLTLMAALWTVRRFPALAPGETYGLDRNPAGAAFALMIAAPLGEELLFRGVLLRGFAPRYGEAKGILLGAALFSAAHLSPVKIFGTFLLGVIFGWWRVRTGSVWPGVLGHALNNGAPVAMAILTGGAAARGGAIPPFSWAEPAVALAGAALLARGAVAMRRGFHKAMI